ncbi:hypothetical protein D3C74_405110 [compost metagenome]
MQSMRSYGLGKRKMVGSWDGVATRKENVRTASGMKGLLGRNCFIFIVISSPYR